MTGLNISWIVPDELAVGRCPATSDLEDLIDENITAILNLQEASECPLAEGVKERFRWMRLPTPDGYFGGAPEVRWLREAVEILREWKREGLVSYVHCYAGQGRSPLVCMAYLVTEHLYTPATAIAMVKITRPISDPSVDQLAALCEYLRQL